MYIKLLNFHSNSVTESSNYERLETLGPKILKRLRGLPLLYVSSLTLHSDVGLECQVAGRLSVRNLM